MKTTSKFTLKFYWRYIKEHKVAASVTIISVPAASLLINTALPYFFSQAIGKIVEKSVDINHILIYAGVTGFIGVLLNFIGFQTLTRLEANIGAKIREDTFKHLITKDMRFFVNQKIGSMTGKYIDFFRSYVQLQDLLVIRTLGFSLSLIIGLIILASKSALLASILIVLLTLLIIEVKWSMNKREPWRQARKEYRVALFGKVADGLTNHSVVKAFGNEKHEFKSIKNTNELFRRAFIKDISFLAAEGSARIFILVAVQVTAISVSAHLIQAGNIDISTAIFCITYLQLVGSQLFSIAELLNGYEQSLLDASPMSEMLMQRDEVIDLPNAKVLKEFSPNITVDNVVYKYDDAKAPAIKGISFTVPAGQKVGLVGHSGSGKTTLSQLLLRFTDVTGGKILIDGNDIRDISQDSLRQAIGYVAQESLLFHRSLRENLVYGKPNASDEEVIEAAKKAHAWEFIKELPNGLGTTVGERGVKLSGGQRQRIAIARAILKDAPILVLDEATSALDSASEKLIQTSLETLMKNRTSIVIAHRLSTIAKLDRIIVLDRGQIVEDGTHAELLKLGGVYADLWRHQSGGFIEE